MAAVPTNERRRQDGTSFGEEPDLKFYASSRSRFIHIHANRDISGVPLCCKLTFRTSRIMECLISIAKNKNMRIRLCRGLLAGSRPMALILSGDYRLPPLNDGNHICCLLVTYRVKVVDIFPLERSANQHKQQR